MTLFYDSTRPWLIPAGSAACLYSDGLFEAARGQAARFSAVRWITVLGNPGSGAFDYEQGNAEDQLASWAQRRIDVQKMRGRLYCGGDNLPKAKDQLGALWDHPRLLLWYPTLDGDRRTAGQVADLIRAQTGIIVPVGKLWGQQYAGGPDADYDTSVLFGTW